MIKNVKRFMERNQKKLYAVFASGVVTMGLSSAAYAADGNWGVNAKTWIATQASALGIAAVVIILIPFIMKKMWAAMIGTLFGGAVALYFINNPDTLTAIGATIKGIVFGS